MIINIANFNFDGGSGGGSGTSGIDFSSIGYDAELSAELNANFNNDVAYSKTLYDAWNPSNTSANNLYSGDTKLVYAPNIDTSNVIATAHMFNSCSNLKTVPEYDTSKVGSMNTMFSGCTSLTSVPLFNTSNVHNMASMFASCTSLTSVPEFDTSKVTSMNSMFSLCSNITSVPSFDTSEVTTIGSMFRGCISLISVPEFDTSKVTSMSDMFNACSKLTTIEGISVKSMKTISSTTLFGYNKNNSIRKAVFKDIGTNTGMTKFDTSYVENWGINTSEIPDARQSLIDSLITYSFDRATAGYPTCAITLSSTTKALLTADEIAQIETKGYSIA